MKATVYIQCTAPNGKIGTFLATGEKPNIVLQTPVFPDGLAMLRYLQVDGWKFVLNSPKPTGEYEKEDSQ